MTGALLLNDTEGPPLLVAAHDVLPAPSVCKTLVLLPFVAGKLNTVPVPAAAGTPTVHVPEPEPVNTRVPVKPDRLVRLLFAPLRTIVPDAFGIVIELLAVGVKAVNAVLNVFAALK